MISRYKIMNQRNTAWCLLTEFTQSESLRKHALAVEACMRACARKFGGSGEKDHVGTAAPSTSSGQAPGCPAERSSGGALAPEGMSDEDLWGIVGLLHDFDYEKYPSLQDHPYKGNEILKDRGWPEVIRRAIMSHAEY